MKEDCRMKRPQLQKRLLRKKLVKPPLRKTPPPQRKVKPLLKVKVKLMPPPPKKVKPPLLKVRVKPQLKVRPQLKPRKRSLSQNHLISWSFMKDQPQSLLTMKIHSDGSNSIVMQVSKMAPTNSCLLLREPQRNIMSSKMKSCLCRLLHMLRPLMSQKCPWMRLTQAQRWLWVHFLAQVKACFSLKLCQKVFYLCPLQLQQPILPLGTPSGMLLTLLIMKLEALPLL